MITPKDKICLTFDHDSEGAERIHSDALPDSRMGGLDPRQTAGSVAPEQQRQHVETLAQSIATLTGTL